MSALRVVVVDDEAPARALLREYLATLPEVEVIAECGNGFEAVRAVEELHPDLLLLDVQMPKLSGFDVLEMVEREVAVVFVTAFDQYAVRAFEVQAVDYLLKPVALERLQRAVERVRYQLGKPRAAVAAQLASAAAPEPGPLERLVLRDGARVDVVPVDAVDVVEAQDDCVVVRAKGRRWRKTSTLQEVAERLDPRRFVRVHRCFVLNLASISGLETYAKDSRLAVLRDGSKVPVSRAGYARLRQLMRR
ncbi:MAG: response regulator [Thermoanaerobaculaceae bacterium]|nr:response regulator [Thermoanaerobaculaceae bacterium]MDI9620995.1 response regulator [Acidobacteriota bacterium]HPW56683.1 response regulator [Thermoanaerobaculaceae bacterium]